jgi:hypothetical protein
MFWPPHVIMNTGGQWKVETIHVLIIVNNKINSIFIPLSISRQLGWREETRGPSQEPVTYNAKIIR